MREKEEVKEDKGVIRVIERNLGKESETLIQNISMTGGLQLENNSDVCKTK